MFISSLLIFLSIVFKKFPKYYDNLFIYQELKTFTKFTGCLIILTLVTSVISSIFIINDKSQFSNLYDAIFGLIGTFGWCGLVYI